MLSHVIQLTSVHCLIWTYQKGPLARPVSVCVVFRINFKFAVRIVNFRNAFNEYSFVRGKTQTFRAGRYERESHLMSFFHRGESSSEEVRWLFQGATK